MLGHEMMLQDEKRADLWAQITEASGLDPQRFASESVPLVNNFMDHCQLLPDSSHNYYSEPGGLLDYSLNRTESALKLFHQFVLPDGQGELSEIQKLWEYVLFSAAILQGIGKLYIDYSIKIYDKHGQFLAPWNPLLTSMTSQGSHYSYELEKESDIEFRKRLNILMARLLMPATGYAWITSNPEVLTIWLALLNEDYYSAGTLGAILIRADAIALRRYLNGLQIRNYGTRSPRQGRISTFSGGVPDQVGEIEQQLGIEFIQWLTRSLESGLIMINKAPLLMVPGGMVMLPEMFQLFARESPMFKNWQALQKSVLSLGLHRVNAEGTADFRFQQDKTHAMQQGIILDKYAMILPDKVTVHGVGEVSALEIVHQASVHDHGINPKVLDPNNPMLHLAFSGQWLPSAIVEPVLSPGSKNSG